MVITNLGDEVHSLFLCNNLSYQPGIEAKLTAPDSRLEQEITLSFGHDPARAQLSKERLIQVKLGCTKEKRRHYAKNSTDTCNHSVTGSRYRTGAEKSWRFQAHKGADDHHTG
jgi:hypothetical protein